MKTFTLILSMFFIAGGFTSTSRADDNGGYDRSVLDKMDKPQITDEDLADMRRENWLEKFENQIAEKEQARLAHHDSSGVTIVKLWFTFENCAELAEKTHDVLLDGAGDAQRSPFESQTSCDNSQNLLNQLRSCVKDKMVDTWTKFLASSDASTITDTDKKFVRRELASANLSLEILSHVCDATEDSVLNRPPSEIDALEAMGGVQVQTEALAAEFNLDHPELDSLAPKPSQTEEQQQKAPSSPSEPSEQQAPAPGSDQEIPPYAKPAY